MFSKIVLIYFLLISVLTACAEKKEINEVQSRTVNISNANSNDIKEAVPSISIISTIAENEQCKNPVLFEQTGIANNYDLDSKFKDEVVGSTSIEINGDGYCDLIVEYQKILPNCSFEIEESDCENVKQNFYTDFYLSNEAGQHTLDQKGVERRRQTDGGKFRSYSVNGIAQPFIVWDLRGNGRVEKFSEAYLVFNYDNSIEYLDPNDRFEYSIENKKEFAEQVLQFHNEKYHNRLQEN